MATVFSKRENTSIPLETNYSMNHEQGDDPASGRIVEPGMPAGARSVWSPSLISVILLAYYLGVGQVPAGLVRLIPSLNEYFQELAIALFAQVVYGLGGAVLAFWLSAAKRISVWLSDCALHRTNA